MRIDVLTLFPGMFRGPMTESMMWKAAEVGLLDLRLHDIRDWTTDRHRTADDAPYGGGGGMVLRADVVVRAVESVLAAGADADAGRTPVINMSPQGRLFSHAIALELSKLPRFVLLCGHYEGIDERALQMVVTDELSIGDYVLTSGELAAMVVIDAAVRLQPGVLGAEMGAAQDSHADGLLEGPHYTRPQVFRGAEVPQVLQRGNHAEIERWRRQQALRRTWRNRPDLLMTAPLDDADRYFLAQLANEDAQQHGVSGG